MRIVFTGGGTGGHIYPALAIAKYLLTINPEISILFIGTKNGLEADLVPRSGFQFAAVSSQGLQRRLAWSNIKSGFIALRGLYESKKILSKFAPDLVVGTGGYVCGPVVLTAHLMGIPTAIHEQNAWPGITNRLLSRVAGLIMVNFPESISRFLQGTRLTVTGLPVRPEIMGVDRWTGAQRLRLNPYLKTILVVGGSRGARSINQAMLRVLGHYSDGNEVQIIQVTGTEGYGEMQKNLEDLGLYLGESGNIRVVPYLYDIENALAIADLMICRAGAATLAEITVKGIPSILIPYPYASENHQEYNARALESQGAAIVIKDRELSGESLLCTIQQLLETPNQLARMEAAAAALGRPKAVEEIVDLLMDLISK
jgi:UDP-N-acetylglucosamine--N-acetylmuramyl-(pentapeptide) pyrophosphoryl-undecaprenol N-acetylglucosamine transferase